MAKQIKVLKCPHCGNSKPIPVGNEHYRCDKCGTEFFLDSDDVNINIHHRHETVGNRNTPPPPSRPPASNKTGLWFVLIFIIALGAILMLKVCSPSRTATKQTIPVQRVESGKYYFSMMLPVRNNAVAFTIESKSFSDSVYAVFSDITTGELLRKRALLPKSNISSGVAHRYFLSDDTNYLILGTNLIYKIHPDKYTLTDVTDSICTRKPALKAGIMSATFVDERHGEGFRLHTNLGKDLFYFPTSDVLCTEKAFKYMATDKSLPTARLVDYYLFQNKETSYSSNVAELLEISYLFNNGAPENKLMHITGNELKNSNHYRISSHKAITEERVYFSPQVLYSDWQHILIMYTPTLAQDAGVHIELLNKEGKVQWTVPFAGKLNLRGVIRTSSGFMLQVGATTFCLITKDGKTTQIYKLSE